MISTGITLNNNMSGTINNIINNLEDLINTSKETQSAVNEMASSVKIPDIANTANIDVTDEIQNNMNAQSNFNDEMNKTNEIAGKVKSVIAGMVGAYIGLQGIKKFVGTADEFTMIKARLDMINDGQQTTLELQDQIFQSAQRARGEYTTTLDIITKLGSQAKDAFSNNQETIAFAENLNKLFAISGTSASGMESVMYNLTQAMASGVLRGQDLNAVISNTPQLLQIVAEYMGTNIGQIRELAQEGKLSASVIKNALLGATDDINEQFEKMPMTFGQIKQSAINTFTHTLQPALANLNEFLNTDKFTAFVSNVSIVMGLFAHVVGFTVELFVGGFNAMATAVEVLQGPLIGILAIFALYNGALIAKNAMELVSAAHTKILELGLWGAVQAQLGLNAAILASPIFWIPALIIGVISLLYGVVGVINKVTGSSVSATGIIVGVITAGIAHVINQFILFYNHTVIVAENIFNTFKRLGEFLANFATHPLQATLRVFERFAQSALNIIKNLASGIDAVFGSNLEGAVAGWQNSLGSKVDSLLSSDYKKFNDVTFERKELIQIKDAFQFGYDKGQNLASGVSNLVSGMFNTDKALPQQEALKDLASMPEALSEPTKALGKDMGKVKDNTKKIKDALDDKIEFKNEDLAYLRELATERAITQYSLDKVMVEVKNEFGDVHENVDLDGWQNSLVDGLLEAVETGIGGLGNAPA